jgi:plastocyanin
VRPLLIAWILLLATLSPATAQQQAPGPNQDRVGFPDGYRTDFVPFYTFDHDRVRQVRVIYANPVAATAQPGQPFPYGSILVQEIYRAVVDEQGNPIVDENGRLMRGELTVIEPMRKEPGFGADYGPNRTGEWEYARYRPDGAPVLRPEETSQCAACHAAAGASRDWVFRANLHFGGANGAVPTAAILNGVFVPGTLTVTSGATVTWYQVDNAVNAHTVTALDGGFDSGLLRDSATFSYRFTRAGTYEYVCTLHPTMRAKVVVEG